MKSIVVYESMFGGTHRLADAIKDGLLTFGPCDVLHAREATHEFVDAAELVVVGAPTMAHTLSTHQSRAAAREQAEHPKDGAASLVFEEVDLESGIREWLAGLGTFDGKSCAAFDTRVDMAELLTGHASHSIAKRLRKHGFTNVVDPRSFLVDKQYVLLPDQPAEATRWADTLARKKLNLPVDRVSI